MDWQVCQKVINAAARSEVWDSSSVHNCVLAVHLILRLCLLFVHVLALIVARQMVVRMRVSVYASSVQGLRDAGSVVLGGGAGAIRSR
jgi:uncharacterized SAM-binding protein YcdF (DUF218 family)